MFFLQRVVQGQRSSRSCLPQRLASSVKYQELLPGMWFGNQETQKFFIKPVGSGWESESSDLLTASSWLGYNLRIWF